MKAGLEPTSETSCVPTVLQTKYDVKHYCDEMTKNCYRPLPNAHTLMPRRELEPAITLEHLKGVCATIVIGIKGISNRRPTK